MCLWTLALHNSLKNPNVAKNLSFLHIKYVIVSTEQGSYQYCFCVQITLRSRNYVLAIRLATLLIPRRHLRKRKSSQQKKRYKDFFKYIFILKPKQLFNIVYVNVCVKRFYSHKTSNNILFGYEKIPESRFSVPWSSLWWLKITYHIELEKRIPQIQIILLHSLTSAS